MTVTVSNVNETIFDALSKFLSQWQDVEVKRNDEKTAQDYSAEQQISAAKKLCGILSHEEAEEIRKNRVNFSERISFGENDALHA